jgi:hypothetical protein
MNYVGNLCDEGTKILKRQEQTRVFELERKRVSKMPKEVKGSLSWRPSDSSSDIKGFYSNSFAFRWRGERVGGERGLVGRCCMETSTHVGRRRLKFGAVNASCLFIVCWGSYQHRTGTYRHTYRILSLFILMEELKELMSDRHRKRLLHSHVSFVKIPS